MSNPVTNLSVIICTHNPRPAYMRRVLNSLREQTLGMENWELLVIDNASNGKVADEWDLSWHPRARHVRENTLGLMSARLRGIADSIGALLVFVDDDTILDLDFLDRALAISTRHPNLGAFGAGTLEPEFEIDPPAEFVSRLHLLGIRTVTAMRWSRDPNDSSCRPWGPGLCVTRDVARSYQELEDRLRVSHVVGRQGQNLFSGEDDLFAWATSAIGKAFGLFPELRVTHLILAERMAHDYFVRLMHDHTFSHSVLRHLLTGAKLQRLNLSKCLRLLAHGLKNGEFSMRCSYAQLRGEADASRFVEERQIRPLDRPFQVVSTWIVCLVQFLASG